VNITNLFDRQYVTACLDVNACPIWPDSARLEPRAFRDPAATQSHARTRRCCQAK
jgi:hypothetical protein